MICLGCPLESCTPQILESLASETITRILHSCTPIHLSNSSMALRSKTYNHVERYRYVGEKVLGNMFGRKISFGASQVCQAQSDSSSEELEEIFYSRSNGTYLWYVDTQALVKFFQTNLTLCPLHEKIFAHLPGMYHKALTLVTRHKLVRGSVVYREGQLGDLAVVAFGQVSLTIKVDKSTSYIKAMIPVRIAEIGALLGAETIVDHHVSLNRVFACTATVTSPIALVYTLDAESLAELRNSSKDIGWSQFIDFCRVNLDELQSSINTVKASIELQNRERVKVPMTAIQLTDQKREFFIMGDRPKYLYKKQEVGKV